MSSSRLSLARRTLAVLAVLMYFSGTPCLAVEKDNPADHIAMGDDQLERCDPGGAIVEYNLALRLNPRLERTVGKWLAVSHFMLAEKLAKQKNNPLALAELDRALKLRPKEAYWHLAKALLEARMGDLESARSECAAATQLEKKDPGLDETCRNPGKRLRYYFTTETPGHPADAFANLEAIRIDATEPVALHVPKYVDELPGSVVGVIATIGADGKASTLQIVKPMGLGLDRKALRILQKSSFEPAMQHGSPIETRALITVSFGSPCHK